MPTYYGPTNIPPIEANLLDCPVAVSDIYGMREQLGDAALFFDPNNEVEIAEIIRNYWLDDDLCDEMKKRGRRTAWKFTQNRFNNDVERIFVELISKTKEVNQKLNEIRCFCNIHKKIYVYGAGRCAFETIKMLNKMYIKVETIFVSNLEENKDYVPLFTVNICGKENINIEDCDGIIIAIVDTEIQKVVVDDLIQSGIKRNSILLFEEFLFRYLIEQ